MADTNRNQLTGIFSTSAVTVSAGCASAFSTEAPGTTEKDKMEIWFVEPLNRMEGHEGFACLILCFPLLEVIMRFELGIPDKQDLTLTDNSRALHWFARFMTIPKREARGVWNAFRNGLLHRAMVKESVPYSLTGSRPGRPAEFKGETLFIYVWDLRDAVVRKLQEHRAKLWKDTSSPLAKIHIVG